MDAASFSNAVRQWRTALGDDYVLTDEPSLAPYANNVSGVKRHIPAVLLPSSTSEVQQLVAVANQFKVPLHPISCGRNWGFGSRLPVKDGTVIVDLGRMKAIREVNVTHHYAVVEPGVTQGQMYRHLEENKLPLVLNVTGTSCEASLIGNALERGIGYFESRAEALTGLEVVLGNGQILRTGFGHYPDAKTAHIYRYGIGPSYEGLFFQSNFGIVTSAGVDLMPRRDAHMAVVCKIDNPDKLPAFIDALADLRRRDVIQTVAHIGNKNRTEIAMAPLVYSQLRRGFQGTEDELRRTAAHFLEAEGFGPWSAVMGVMGTPGQLRAVRSEVRRAFRGLAKVMFLTDLLISVAKRLSDAFSFIPYVRRKRAVLDAVEPLYGLAKGIPTDAPMKSVFWPVGDMPRVDNEDPDQSRCGMLYCCPFIPAEGGVAAEAMDLVDRVYRKYGFVPYVTLNLLDTRALECVINLAFDRDHPAQVGKAHACNDELTGEFIRRGWMPYRLGVQSMGMMVDEKDYYWQLARDLKKVLDPNHIISPGRYNLV